jgi:hypothetical protein
LLFVMLTTLGCCRMSFRTRLRFRTRMLRFLAMRFLLDLLTGRLWPFYMRNRRLDRTRMLHFMLLCTRCGFRRGVLLLSVRRVHDLLLPGRLRFVLNRTLGMDRGLVVCPRRTRRAVFSG